MSQWSASLRRGVSAYAEQDPRSLGLLRVGLGALAMLDVARRFPYAATFYANEGVLSNHFALYRPLADRAFSLFLGFSTAAEVRVLLLLLLAAAVALTLGLRTRTAHAIVFVGITSLHARNLLVEAPGDLALRLLLGWSLLLPLGRSFSVDAVVLSLRRSNETNPAELNDRARHPAPEPVSSLAALALRLELVFIALHSPIVLMAQLDASPSGAVLRVAVRCLPWLMTALVLVPFAPRVIRAVALGIAALVCLALAFAADDARMPLVLLGFLPLLLTRFDWEGGYDGPRLHVIYDDDCGFCLQVCRLLVRLDGASRITFAGSRTAGLPLPTAVTAEDAASTVIVFDEMTGTTFRRSAAVARILDTYWFGAPLAAIVRLSPIARWADRAYDLVARNRHSISAWMGYTVCGTRGADGEPVAPLTEPLPAPSTRHSAVRARPRGGRRRERQAGPG